MCTDKPTNPELSALSAIESSDLSALIERAKTLESLDCSLRRCLPEALANQCQLANQTADKLVFQVSNPVWKNKLRLHSQELLEHANALGLHAQEIVIKINPEFSPNIDK
jgi:hypothetical protein